MYLAVICPVIIYGLMVWYTPAEIKNARKDIAEKLDVIQNRCLKIVASVYKATSIEVLQVETIVPPMQIHLDQLQTKACFVLKFIVKPLLYRSSTKG